MHHWLLQDCWLICTAGLRAVAYVGEPCLYSLLFSISTKYYITFRQVIKFSSKTNKEGNILNWSLIDIQCWILQYRPEIVSYRGLHVRPLNKKFTEALVLQFCTNVGSEYLITGPRPYIKYIPTKLHSLCRNASQESKLKSTICEIKTLSYLWWYYE